MTRRDFRTPSIVPEGYITRCITIPANQEWLGLVNAALLMLTEPWRYTQVFDTDLTPAETAAIAFDMYVAYLAGCEVDMSCSDVIACMLPYIQAQQIAGGTVRLDPVTDEPQVSFDGGVTWTDVPQSPQPVQTPTPTPTPGSDDAERICLASTRAALIIAEFYSQTFGAFTADLLNTLNGINQFLHSINTALYNLIYSPYEGILEAAGWFDFDFTTNYTAGTLTTAQIEDITCLLQEHATVNASGIVEFNHAAVQAALISVLGVNPGTAVTLNVSNMRSEGLQAASQVAITDTGVCAHCEEDGPWQLEYDFSDGTAHGATIPQPCPGCWASNGYGGVLVNGQGIDGTAYFSTSRGASFRLENLGLVAANGVTSARVYVRKASGAQTTQFNLSTSPAALSMSFTNSASHWPTAVPWNSNVVSNDPAIDTLNMRVTSVGDNWQEIEKFYIFGDGEFPAGAVVRTEP